MSNKELKPCPFCGGEAEYKIFNDTCYKNNWYSMVHCNKCGTIMQGDYNEAIEKWNTRNYPEIPDSSKLKRSDIENIVKIEWKIENSIIYADVFYLRLHYQRKKDFFCVYAGVFYDNDSPLSFISKASSEDEAKQIARKFVIDTICDALKIEE